MEGVDAHHTCLEEEEEEEAPIDNLRRVAAAAVAAAADSVHLLPERPSYVAIFSAKEACKKSTHCLGVVEACCCIHKVAGEVGAAAFSFALDP